MQTRANMVVIVLIVVGAMPALISFLDLLSYFRDVNGYTFGTEIGPYFYTTAYHFVGFHGLVLGLFLVAVVARQWLVRILAAALQLSLMAVAFVI